MKHFTRFVSLVALLSLALTGAMAQSNNVITYTASQKLNIESSRFSPEFVSHEYDEATEVGTITFDSDVEVIGDYAFGGNGDIHSIVLPNSVTKIGGDCFLGCDGLQSVILPDGLEYIGNRAFKGCNNLESIAIPASVTSIGGDAFAKCPNLSLTIDVNNTTYKIVDGYILTTDGTTLVSSLKATGAIPSGVTAIFDSAFNGRDDLTSFTIPEGVTTIGDNAFDDCINLTSITIPASVTNIGEAAFAGCKKLPSVVIPDGVTVIKDLSFRMCYALESITIPAGVKSLDFMAFAECKSLKSITCKAKDVPGVGGDCFYEVDKTIPVYVPAQSLDAYKAADGWKDFTNFQPIVTVDNGVTIDYYGSDHFVVSYTNTFFDSGYVPTAKTTIVAQMKPMSDAGAYKTGSKTEDGFFGVCESGKSEVSWKRNNGNHDFLEIFTDVKYSGSENSAANGAKYTFVLKNGSFKSFQEQNGEMKVYQNRAWTPGTFNAPSKTIYIGAVNQSDNKQYRSNALIYFFDIYEDDQLVKHFVPAYKDGQFCLYETIGQTYAQNIGSGNEVTCTADHLFADVKAGEESHALCLYCGHSFDLFKAEEVMGRIGAIGTVEVTEACKSLIDEARTAYDSLTDSQKTLVSNYSTLTGAETEYESLQTPTGIEIPSAEKAADAQVKIYDLSGRQLQHLQKGINIVNGRKVVVK